MPVHLVGISGGGIWHTIRNPSGWDPWDDVLATAGSLAGSPSRVACGVVSGALHVCVDTQVSLFHTIRFGRGSWQGWGDAGSVAFPGVLGAFNVDCVGIGNELHVCVEGFTVRGQLRTLPAAWHTIRISNPDPSRDSWTARKEVTGRYRTILDLACGKADGNLHVLARCMDVAGVQRLMHTIRLPNGSLQPGGDADVFSLSQFSTTASTLRQTGAVAAAGIGPQLHVVASDGAEPYHTISAEQQRVAEHVRAYPPCS
jgi:hypothetical protein